jgi:putative PIN family toxin of toxin-antitoxin system
VRRTSKTPTPLFIEKLLFGVRKLQKSGIGSKIGIIYNTSMIVHQIVIGTNVFVTSLRSQYGASYKLLSLIKSEKFNVNMSVPLVLEYEASAKKMIGEITLKEKEIDDILDFVISKANHWQIYYLWRPQLKDPGDDMVLELAVTANCEYIVTYNLNDFKGSEKFGVKAITPKEFLQKIGEL